MGSKFTRVDNGTLLAGVVEGAVTKGRSLLMPTAGGKRDPEIARLYLDRLSFSDQFAVLDATIADLERAKGMCHETYGRARLQKSIRHYERRREALAAQLNA